MYVVGFAETVRDILRDNDSLIVDESNDIRIIGVVTIVILLGVTMVGLQWVVCAQVIFLSVLVISILNVVIGTFIGPQSEESKAKGFLGYKKDLFETNWGSGFKGESFVSVFAVFFPATTGILGGVSISNDLKEVHKAVPKGTLLAVLISTLVYVMLAWFLGACVEREALGLVHDAVNTTNGSIAPCVSQKCQYGLLNDFQVLYYYYYHYYCRYCYHYLILSNVTMLTSAVFSVLSLNQVLTCDFRFLGPFSEC